MGVFNGAFPVPAGKEDEAREFAQEASGSHRSDYDALMRASTTRRVTWTLQPTQVGTMLSVWFEADDPDAIFRILATSSGDDAAWMRGRILDVLGLDMTVPPEGPPPEEILAWSE